MMHDMERDAELGAALRDAAGSVPADVDWNALRSRIAASAELPLAGRRRAARPAWQRRVRGWAPIAAAAGVAAAALSLTLRDPRPSRPALTADDRQVVEAIVNESLPGVDGLVSGTAASDALLQAAVGGTGS